MRDTCKAAFAIADRLDTTPRDARPTPHLFPISDRASAIARLDACADRIRYRAEANLVDDRERELLDEALGRLLDAINDIEAAA